MCEIFAEDRSSRLAKHRSSAGLRRVAARRGRIGTCHRSRSQTGYGNARRHNAVDLHDITRAVTVARTAQNMEQDMHNSKRRQRMENPASIHWLGVK